MRTEEVLALIRRNGPQERACQKIAGGRGTISCSQRKPHGPGEKERRSFRRKRGWISTPNTSPLSHSRECSLPWGWYFRKDTVGHETRTTCRCKPDTLRHLAVVKRQPAALGAECSTGVALFERLLLKYEMRFECPVVEKEIDTAGVILELGHRRSCG